MKYIYKFYSETNKPTILYLYICIYVYIELILTNSLLLETSTCLIFIITFVLRVVECKYFK